MYLIAAKFPCPEPNVNIFMCLLTSSGFQMHLDYIPRQDLNLIPPFMLPLKSKAKPKSVEKLNAINFFFLRLNLDTDIYVGYI